MKQPTICINCKWWTSEGVPGCFCPFDIYDKEFDPETTNCLGNFVKGA